jgi:hypothetical protein
LTNRADILIQSCLCEAWDPKKASLSGWKQSRNAGWIAPGGTFHKLYPGQEHKDWVSQPIVSPHLKAVHRNVPFEMRNNWGVMRSEMMKQGWIQKLDHDQYQFQPADYVAPLERHQWAASVIKHFDTHHPVGTHFEVGIEDPETGQDKKHYFMRHPNTHEMIPRDEWRAERAQQSPSTQKRKWKDPLALF